MKIIISEELTHKVNNNYQGVLVQFTDFDKNYFHNKKNWLPNSSEAFALHKLMYALDKNYRSLILSDLETFVFKKEFFKFKVEVEKAIEFLVRNQFER